MGLCQGYVTFFWKIVIQHYYITKILEQWWEEVWIKTALGQRYGFSDNIEFCNEYIQS